jgi:hypothetical protein
MEACLIAVGVLLTATLVTLLVVALRPRAAPTEPPHQIPRRRFEFCPACDAPLFPNDRDCPSCGLDLDSRAAAQVESVRIARREIRHLKESGLLDGETAARVTQQLDRRKQLLRHHIPRPAETSVAPLDQPTLEQPAPTETHRAEPPPLPRRQLIEELFPPTPEPAVPPPAPPPPRRSLADHLGRFMHERNILWGELAGGLLIVGCSIALVLSLWRTLESLPYFTFLLSAGITAAVFGAGYYTFHHWRLAATSRGLLAIALLLTPLNLLLLADPGTRGSTDVLDSIVKAVAVFGFLALVRTAGRDFVGTDELPGWLPRRWLLAVTLVGTPAVLMVPLVLPAWLSLAFFVIGVGPVVVRLYRDGRQTGSEPLGERPATELLLFVGLGLFALFAAWGPFLARADNLPEALRHLALPVVIAGSVIVGAGLVVQQRVTEPAGLRATGTGVVLFGIVILFASLVLGWPDLGILVVTALAVATLLGALAYVQRLPWLYAGAIPCLALVSVVLQIGSVPAGVDPGPWLAEGITSAPSGTALAVFALLLLAVSEVFVRCRRLADGRALAVGAAGVAIVGLFIATVHGIEEPEFAAWTHIFGAVGFVAASFRWRYRVIAQAGVWLILLASLWGLWATAPGELHWWGLTAALEALVLATVAVVLGHRSGLHRLKLACRDVAAAAALLAPVLAMCAADFPRGAAHSGTLFAVASTALVLAGLYRQAAFTWIGSLTALVALGHLLAFTLSVEPGQMVVVLALLIHATLATGAVLVFWRLQPEPPDDDPIGPLTRLRTRTVYADPLQLSARLTLALAVPFLLVPAAGLAGAWAGFTVWVGVLFLIAAVGWRERGGFAAFQGALTWAAVLVGFTWVERQDWFAESSAVDPRAIQTYGIALGLLSIGWLITRRLLRGVDSVRELWADVRPSVDQVVLGGLVIGHLFVAAAWVMPHVRAELIPLGEAPELLPGAAAIHVGGPGAWLLVGVVTIALGLGLRWSKQADFPVLGLTLLALTLPVLIAARFVGELASASAIRWGLAAVFLLVSIVLGGRESIGRVAARTGITSTVSAHGLLGVRSLLVAGGGVVLLLTLQVAAIALTGRVPAGPVAGSVFREMGWTASIMVPLAALVTGLAWTAVRERSAGYASAGGWVWVLAVAGGYALGIVAAGGHLGAAESMRIGLLAVGATAAWALAWLAVEWRVPGRRLLTVHVVAPFVGLAVLALLPLVQVVVLPGQAINRFGGALLEFSQIGWPMLVLTAAAGYCHVWRVQSETRFYVIGFTAAMGGILAAAVDLTVSVPGSWSTFHVLALTWVVNGCLVAIFLFWPPGPDRGPAQARRLWPELLAGGLTVLGLRAMWSDPFALAPAGMVLCAGLLVGTVAFAGRSRLREYAFGFLVVLAAVLVNVRWGPDTGSSLALAIAAALALTAWVWSELRGRGLIVDMARVPPDEAKNYDDLGRAGSVGGERNFDPVVDVRRSPVSLPPYPHVAAELALGLGLFGLIPTWSGANVDSPLLAWGAVLAVGAALGILLRYDWRQRFAAAGLYILGIAVILLAGAGIRPGPVWLDWTTTLALSAYAVAACLFAARLNFRRPTAAEVRPWFIVGQGLLGVLVIGMAVRTSVVEASLLIRLSGALAVGLLVPAAALLVRLTANSATLMRQSTLILGAIALGLLAWALPDPDGAVPWLNRHAGLFAALTLTAAGYLESRRSGSWSPDLGRVGIVLGGLALVALGVELIQQIPQFDPDLHVRRTPLDPVAVAAVLAGILALIVVGLRLALRPDRDPLGPAPHGRTGYVYLAEVLLVLMFAHVRLNVPQVFTGQAVRYWTFIVMLLAFIGVGLAELFARRGLHVLSRPLLRTGVLLPLIPLLVFWAKPPGLVFEFADARAPGLRPMLGYLEKLPQHFDAYALLWFLAGLLYGLVALSRRSFGWALLGALATNAGLWALLAHHQVPAAVHPQAWAIPLALIVLVSEHVNRYRLRTDVASGLRYLGISMIYVASAADLFIAGVGESLWLPIVLAVLCLAGVVAGVLLRVRAFLYLSIGFLLLDVFSMIWHAAVDRAQTWVWYASGIVLGVIILAVFALLEKRRNDVQELVGRLREWD